MKTPDPASETFRAGTRGEVALAEPGPARSEEHEELEFEPKYLTYPQRRFRGHGRRNLIAGVGLLFLSAALFGWALFLAGPGAAYTVAGVVATGAALHVMARARLLRQRNGGFLAGSIICLLGVFLVLVQQAWVLATRPVPHPVAAAAPAPAATPAPLPAFLEVFRPTAAEMSAGTVAKILRPLKVEVDDKTYRLRAGDLLPIASLGRDEVRLAAGTQEVAVPMGAVELQEPRETAPARPPVPEAPATSNAKDAEELTRRSHQDAMQKYPGLKQAGSPENRSFVEAYRELKYGGHPEFFEDPEWPLRLADQLASREGWGQPKAPAPAPAPIDRIEDPVEIPRPTRPTLRTGPDADLPVR